MKTIAYIRVSTKEQATADKFGISTQRQTIEKYADMEGLSVDEWFIDKGQSGSKLDRPELQALLNYVSSNPAKVLVAYVDRWARDSFLFHFLNKELLTADSELVSATEEALNDDSPHAQLMQNITVAFAQFERQRIAARMQGGRRQKAKKGEMATGRIPYGFRKAADGSFVQEPEEIKALQYIHHLRFDKTMSYRMIADRLNEKGVDNRSWSATTVRYMLNNEKYYGTLNQTIGSETFSSESAVFQIFE